MVLDSEQLEKNALTLLKLFSNAKIILKEATGQKNYQQIAKDLNINPKIVSPALSLAKDLGFAEKIKPGVYRKITSHMKYIPNKKLPNKKIFTIDNIIQKFSKKQDRLKPVKAGYSLDYKNKVEKMAKAYRWLFITENSLRELIRKVIGASPTWWEDRVPEGIKKNVEETIQNSRYDEAKRRDNLEYTHLGQLKEIIIFKKNWRDFEPFLKSKDKHNFDVEINRVIPSRDAIGHCISLIGDDYKYAEMRFQAILKLLK